jgi:Flp pilus assembly protein TadG
VHTLRRRPGSAPAQPADERGQSLVEFAIVVPVLILVICAIVEFGNLLMTQEQIQNGVREGSRYAALSSCAATSSSIQQEVQDAANGLGISVSTSYSPSGCTSCNGNGVLAGIPTVTVTGTYTYTPITPIAALFTLNGGTWSLPTLTSSSTFNNEC